MTTSIHAADSDVPVAHGPLRSLWAEVTGKCQLSCVHCYAGSGPEGTHGTMTVGQWKTVLTDAAALGTQAVCFIGGEPTMYPDLPELVRHALSVGMEVEVYTNLVFVSRKMWELFSLPGVRVATSWYSSDREEHKQVTGRDTWRQTLANIEEVMRRGIPLRVGIIDGIVPGQHVKEGEALLRERGVVNIGGDYLREFGRGTTCDPSQACGNCGQGRAAVLPDGTVTPCPLTRWMDAGNVADAPLAAILPDVVRVADTIPAVRARYCKPFDDCGPQDTCRPDCAPQGGRVLQDACEPNTICGPQTMCAPDKAVAKNACEPADCAPEVGCSPTFCSPACGPTHAVHACGPHNECGPDVCRPYDECHPGRADLTRVVVEDKCAPEECAPDVCKPDWYQPVTDCQPDCTPYSCVPEVRCGPDYRVAVPVGAVVQDTCVPPCAPNNDCRPDIRCMPNHSQAVTVVQDACNPDCSPSDCRPDAFCVPLCSPSACRPNIRADVNAGPDCAPDDCRPDAFCEPLCSPSACRPNVQCRPETECRPNRPF